MDFKQLDNLSTEYDTIIKNDEYEVQIYFAGKDCFNIDIRKCNLTGGYTHIFYKYRDSERYLNEDLGISYLDDYCEYKWAGLYGIPKDILLKFLNQLFNGKVESKQNILCQECNGTGILDFGFYSRQCMNCFKEKASGFCSSFPEPGAKKELAH